MEGFQHDKCFTMVPNKIIEKLLRGKFNATQLEIIFAIIRATYGFHVESRTLGLTFFAKATGRHTRQIGKELKTLVGRRVVLVLRQYTFGRSRELKVNEMIEEWLGYE